MHRLRLALIILFAGGSTALVAVSPFWYLQAVFTVLFYLVALMHLIRDLDIFYAVCAGELPVVLAGIYQVWAGLALQLLLVGILAEGAGFLRSGRDMAAFLVFCLLAILVSSWVLASRQVIFPMLALAIAGLAAVAACLLAEYRYTAPFRRNVR